MNSSSKIKPFNNVSEKSIDPGFLNLLKVEQCYDSISNGGGAFRLGPISLNVKEGEFIAIVGPSGSGKTMLLRNIAGLETPQAGKISIDGKVIFNNKFSVPAEKRQVGMMFQEHALFPHLTVRNNILFGIRHLNKDARNRRLYELEYIVGLEDYLDRFPHELSGGQQQRVALARTLAPSPKIILLDEPLSSLDAGLRLTIAQDLRDVLKKTNTTALWVTHDQSEALDLAERIIVLNKGKLEQIDDPWFLYNKPKTRFVADFIGHAVFLKGELKGSVILTEIGSIDCPPCLQSSEKLEVMIRPDDVSVSTHDDGVGCVCKRQFLGAIQLYTICLPSKQHIFTYQAPHINWPIGTKVQIRPNLKAVVAFPSSS